MTGPDLLQKQDDLLAQERAILENLSDEERIQLMQHLSPPTRERLGHMYARLESLSRLTTLKEALGMIQRRGEPTVRMVAREDPRAHAEKLLRAGAQAEDVVRQVLKVDIAEIQEEQALRTSADGFGRFNDATFGWIQNLAKELDLPVKYFRFFGNAQIFPTVDDARHVLAVLTAIVRGRKPPF